MPYLTRSLPINFIRIQNIFNPKPCKNYGKPWNAHFQNLPFFNPPLNFLHLLQLVGIVESGFKLHRKKTLDKNSWSIFQSNELWVHLSTQSSRSFISHRKLFFDFVVVVIIVVWNHLMYECVKFFHSIDEWRIIEAMMK